MREICLFSSNDDCTVMLLAQMILEQWSRLGVVASSGVVRFSFCKEARLPFGVVFAIIVVVSVVRLSAPHY